jgi:hypothetical protein
MNSCGPESDSTLTTPSCPVFAVSQESSFLISAATLEESSCRASPNFPIRTWSAEDDASKPPDVVNVRINLSVSIHCSKRQPLSWFITLFIPFPVPHVQIPRLSRWRPEEETSVPTNITRYNTTNDHPKISPLTCQSSVRKQPREYPQRACFVPAGPSTAMAMGRNEACQLRNRKRRGDRTARGCDAPLHRRHRFPDEIKNKGTHATGVADVAAQAELAPRGFSVERAAGRIDLQRERRCADGVSANSSDDRRAGLCAARRRNFSSRNIA